MKTLAFWHLVASLLDLATDGFLKGLAIYLIFWQHAYFAAAIVFGCSGLYSLSMVAGRVYYHKFVKDYGKP